MSQVNGSTTGGEPIHSDNPGPMQKTPQANGGVKPIIKTYGVGNWDKLMPGERGIGDIPRNGA